MADTGVKVLGWLCSKHSYCPSALRMGLGKLGVVAHTFNPSSQEAEAGGSLLVQGQPGLQSEF